MSPRPRTLKKYADRKIGYHHYAFYRGWIQGMDLNVLADLYLDTGTDLRIAKSTLVWLRDSFSQAALRQGHRGEARLLRVHLQQKHKDTSSVNNNIPDLEEFRDRTDPDNFYRESEIYELYKQTFPEAFENDSLKRQKLIERQLKALYWVQELMVTTPNKSDSVLAWFDQSIAARLINAKLLSIGDIVDTISRKGDNWWRKIPRIGEKGGKRIQLWLTGYFDTINHQASCELLSAVPDQDKPMFPVLFDHDDKNFLSGASGSNRHQGVQRITAKHDMEAIKKWINIKSVSVNTARVYRKEAERFVLWSIIDRKKPISDLSIDDCVAYKNWLTCLGKTNPDSWPYATPQDLWIGKRNTPRFSTEWKPFDGPLKEASIKYALTVLSSMFDFLVSVQYLSFNPWVAVNKKTVHQADEKAPDIEMTRTFSGAQWDYMLEYLSQSEIKDVSYLRLKFVLEFAYTTGLRLSELVTASIERLYTMPLKDQVGSRWMLKVHGKGNKWRTVPVPEKIIAHLSDYLVMRGFSDDPLACPKSLPLIANLNGIDFMSGSNLYKIITRFFRNVSSDMESKGHFHEAQSLKKASVHWIRHACGSNLGDNGVPVNLIQKLLGHASIATTSIYTDSDDETLWNRVSILNHERSIDL